MITVNFTLQRSTFDVSIHETFHAGITGIFGPSGSGKTSLLNAIAGLVTPHEGTIVIHENVVFNAAANINTAIHRRHIGYVFQNGRLFPHMTVEKNLRYGMQKKRPQMLGFDEIVTILKLDRLLKNRPTAISGGEYQRVALGRALLSSPEILLLDEPFSAVDAALRSQIIPYLLAIQRKINIPMLVVSHELPDLLRLTDRLCIISEGKCAGHDDYHRLLESPAVRNLLGGGPLLNVITMKTDRIIPSSGLTQLTHPEGTANVRILCEKSSAHYSEGEYVKLFISSRDIALSSRHLSNVTIQNQLEGTVTDIFEKDSTSFCVVDAGFRLVVEITAESRGRLDIRIGDNVWCLFKSVAIDVAI